MEAKMFKCQRIMQLYVYISNGSTSLCIMYRPNVYMNVVYRWGRLMLYFKSLKRAIVKSSWYFCTASSYVRHDTGKIDLCGLCITFSSYTQLGWKYAADNFCVCALWKFITGPLKCINWPGEIRWFVLCRVGRYSWHCLCFCYDVICYCTLQLSKYHDVTISPDG